MKAKFFDCTKDKSLSEENINSLRKGEICIKDIVYVKELTEEFIAEFYNLIEPDIWDFICVHYSVSEDFIRKYENYFDWTTISYWQDLSEDFIEEFADKVNWDKIFTIQKLSSEFYRKHCDKICWSNCNMYINIEDFPEDILEKHIDKISFCYAAIWINLSIGFIEKHKGSFDEQTWKAISSYQKLDDDFVINNMDHIYLGCLLDNKDISENIKNYVRMFV